MEDWSPAEQALIAETICAVEWNDAAPIIERISADDFADTAHQTIWRAVRAIHQDGKRPSLAAVDEQLKTWGAVQTAGGSAYLSELLDALNQMLGIEEAARLVWDAASRRRIAQEARLTAEAASGQGGSLKSATGRLRDLLESLEKRSAVQEPVLDGWQAIVEEHERQALPCLETGFVALNDLVQFSPGRLYIFGGRPGSGKTTLTLQIALQSLMKYEEAHALFVSCEMGPGELVKKALCTLTGRDFLGPFLSSASEYSRGRALGEAGQHEKLLRRLHLTYSRSMDDVRKAANRLISQGKPLKLVVVDYISAMSAPSRSGTMETRSREVGAVSRECKRMAQEMGLVVFGPSQLNRASAGQKARAPVLSDLRDSGEIEQDADAVMLLYRADMENPDALADLIVAKNRWGQLGSFTLRPDLARHRFGE
jgi:replicative DNA helicase